MSTSCQLYSFVVDATEVQGLDSVPMTSGPSDINPVITFSDLLQLGADCTVLGTEDDVFGTEKSSPDSLHHFEPRPIDPSDSDTNVGVGNNSNDDVDVDDDNVWFCDVETDFSNFLSNVEPFGFEDNILFEDDSACLNNVSSTNFSAGETSEVKAGRDPATNLFQCPHCAKAFQYSSRLQRHLTVHQSKQFECKICFKFFSRLDVMETHVAKTHRGSNSLCSSSSSSPSSSSSDADDWSPVKRNVKTTSHERRFACSECDAVLSSRHHLERHENSHRNKVGHFVCQHCQKSFSIKHKYQMHLRHHASDRKFKCFQCGLAFLQSEFLARHLLTHSQENPFRCEDCGRGFKQLINLKQHRIRKHPDASGSVNFRRHPCPECDKVFLTSSELKNHRIYHDKVRRFPCTDCGSAFLEKRHLDRHLRRVHSGIKNFFCNVCGKAFFEKFELNYHLRMSSCSLDEK